MGWVSSFEGWRVLQRSKFFLSLLLGGGGAALGGFSGTFQFPLALDHYAFLELQAFEPLFQCEVLKVLFGLVAAKVLHRKWHIYTLTWSAIVARPFPAPLE
jgi:hypothetical protein